ncbi:MAG: penicillin-binding protein [Bacteroidia bacterium]|nr:penicillin-binding protein [Bacteroidia bacterium]
MKRDRQSWNTIVLYGISAITGLFFLFVLYVYIEMPPLNTLENPQTNLSTQVISIDGEVLGNIYHKEHRVNVNINEIPANIRLALVATEDIRFYQHSGVDFRGVLSILYSRLIPGFTDRGGSTITQQLARNLYDEVGRERTFIRKVKEAIVAIILESRYTKEEIMTAYFNTVSFGGDSYGLQAGSFMYFSKNCRELTMQESALMVGLLKGPGYYNPVKYPDRARNRRNTVISQMQKYGFIGQKEADSLQKTDLVVLNSHRESHNTGLAPYFREHLREWLSKWCKKNNHNMYTEGLRVYTTIHAKIQRHAEEAMQEHLSELQPVFDNIIKDKKPWDKDSMILIRAMRQSSRYATLKQQRWTENQILDNFQEKRVKMRVFAWSRDNNMVDTMMTPWDSLQYYNRFLETGIVAIDPSTGQIRAWVGGIDHKFFQYDHVQKGKRQVGSTFKPFVYTAAFDNNYEPCSEELNQPVEIPTPEGLWIPKNADGSVGGKMTLRKALANSVNIITARVIKVIGPQVVTEYARNMGIQTPLKAVPSLALGTTDLNVTELTSAYSTIANKGRWIEPTFVTRIEDKFGNVLEEFTPDTRDAISERTAYLMVDMLRGVVNEGTAGGLRWMYKIYNMDIGGKTGTTQNHSDGWFVGITPFLACGIWVGCADRNVHFPSLDYGQGGRMAMPIFGKLFKKIEEDDAISFRVTKNAYFERPKNLSETLNCNEYKRLKGNSTYEDEPDASGDPKKEQDKKKQGTKDNKSTLDFDD